MTQHPFKSLAGWLVLLLVAAFALQMLWAAITPMLWLIIALMVFVLVLAVILKR